MRVLHVIGEMGFGGAEVLTAQISSGLVVAGHNVEVLVLGFCEPAAIDALRSVGVIVHAPRAKLVSPANVLRIVKTVRRGSLEVVHAHLFPALYWAALAKALSPRRVRWVYTEHSTSNGRRRRNWLRPLERWVYGRYDSVVCISREAASALREWVSGVTPVVIENGIDAARFATANPLGRDTLCIPTDSIVVLMVGAFRPEKNHQKLLEAFSLLASNHVLVLAGDGAERVGVEDLALRLGVRSRVHFLGAVPDVEKLYGMADVYVLPSHFEGFGISALEAAAAGLPIVHSDVPGLADMIDGAGWPVDPSSARSIADGITMAASAGRGSRQVAHGRIVASRYDIEATIGKHASLYHSLVVPSVAATQRLAGTNKRKS